MHNKLVYGTQFYRAPCPPRDQRKKDMETLKKLNFDTIKCTHSWGLMDTASGKYDFSEILEILDHAQAVGLEVIYSVMNEPVPNWLRVRYPDACYVNANGQRVVGGFRGSIPTGGWPGLCPDHPAVAEAEEKFMTELARTLGNHPALVMWNAWEEPQLPAGPCYCQHTIVLYHEWLDRQYGSIEALNEAWYGTAYSGWDQIDPIRTHGGIPMQMDWRRFITWWMADMLERRVTILRREDPEQHPIMAHTGRSTASYGLNIGIPGSGSRACDDWQLAEKVDIYGESIHPCFNISEEFIPPQFRELHHWRKNAAWHNCMSLDQIRSSADGKPFWIAELQGGRQAEGLYRGPEVKPSDIRTWTLLGLSTGASGILYWQHRHDMAGTEALGFGLLNVDGQLTDRAKEAGRVGAMIRKYNEFFINAKPQEADVAILINQDSLHYTFAAERKEDLVLSSIMGFYRALWRENIAVDFLDQNQVMQGDLKKYRAAILPLPVSMRKNYAKALSDFVEEGGVVVSETSPALFDEHGLAIVSPPGYGLDKAFGVKEKDSYSCSPHMWTSSIRDPDGPQWLQGIEDWKNCKIQIAGWIQHLEPTSAKAIFKSNDKIAGTVNSFGKGKAYVIGTFCGQSLRYYEDEGTVAFLVRILSEAGVRKTIAVETDLIVRRLNARTTNQAEAFILTNVGNESNSVSIPMGMWTSAEDALSGEHILPVGQKVDIQISPEDSRIIIFSHGDKKAQRNQGCKPREVIDIAKGCGG